MSFRLLFNFNLREYMVLMVKLEMHLFSIRMIILIKFLMAANYPIKAPFFLLY